MPRRQSWDPPPGLDAAGLAWLAVGRQLTPRHRVTSDELAERLSAREVEHLRTTGQAPPYFVGLVRAGVEPGLARQRSVPWAAISVVGVVVVLLTVVAIATFVGSQERGQKDLALWRRGRAAEVITYLDSVLTGSPPICSDISDADDEVDALRNVPTHKASQEQDDVQHALDRAAHDCTADHEQLDHDWGTAVRSWGTFTATVRAA